MIRVLEGSVSLVNWQEAICSLEVQCEPRHALDQRLNAFYKYMDTYTLQDVIHNRMANIIIKLQQSHLE